MPTTIGRKNVTLERGKKDPFSSTFFAHIELEKSAYCEKCLGKMKKTGSRDEPAQSGPVAGYTVTTYQCKICGHTHNTYNSYD